MLTAVFTIFAVLSNHTGGEYQSPEIEIVGMGVPFLGFFYREFHVLRSWMLYVFSFYPNIQITQTDFRKPFDTLSAGMKIIIIPIVLVSGHLLFAVLYRFEFGFDVVIVDRFIE